MKTAVVVGGGIGGLGAAIALHRAGWQVTVLERASRIAPLGAGIGLWPNALRALDALGLAAQVDQIAMPQREGGLRRADGRWLARWEGPYLERRMGGALVGVTRPQLHDILRGALPPDSMITGVEVRGLRPDGSLDTDVPLPDADLVIGADGIRSRLRSSLFPSHPGPIYGGVTAWLALADDERRVGPGVYWGVGQEFGVVPLADGRYYWFAGVRAPAGLRVPDDKAHLRALFADWAPDVRSVIEATPAQRLIRVDLHHLATPLPRFSRGRVALLGDAAHATLPYLGQGACQALEDAATLGWAVGRHDDLPAALAAYDTHRRPRSQAVTRASARVGAFGPYLGNRWLAALRDTAVRLTPARLATTGMQALSGWRLPE